MCAQGDIEKLFSEEEMPMDKPINPYRKGTQIWNVFEGDWEDLSTIQIAEVLGMKPKTVRAAIRQIAQDTGYAVPHIKLRTMTKQRPSL